MLRFGERALKLVKLPILIAMIGAFVSLLLPASADAGARGRFVIIRNWRWNAILTATVLFNITVSLTCYSQIGWQLSWSDEFEGSTINPNNWAFDTGTGPPYPGWGNNELEYYTSRPQNAYVTNGMLHIVARQESYSSSSYTSAKMKTAGMFSQTYGRFEFYAKLPAGQGYWPALWLMPQSSVYGGWAASGEIDIVEVRGSNPANVLGTIHYGGAYPNQAQSSGPSFTFPGGGSVTNFHLYALEWGSNSIRWYIDGQLYETQTSWWSSSNPTNTNIRNPYPAPFDQPFYIIMNLAVGGNFGGNPDASTVFPGEMLVDYVRVFHWVTGPPVPPVLRLRFKLDDPTGSTTTSSDTSGGGASVNLQMLNGTGAPMDYHGAANSGVGAPLTASRALDFSSNTAQPGIPGPVAAATNASLGFGVVSNFVVSMWFKQNHLMTSGANIGPRLFLLGKGTPSDTGVADSLGLKFQTSSQLYFQMGATTASATFATDLPTNIWIFVAAVYDGASIKLYQGTETNGVALISSTGASGTIDLGSSAALFLGNRQNLQRSFDGWLADVRFHTGSGDAAFVERLRTSALAAPSTLSIQSSGTNITINWTTGTLQSSPDMLGPWTNIAGATSPYLVVPADPQQFFRLQVQ
jgi:beta-glucanase (GH16 family)